MYKQNYESFCLKDFFLMLVEFIKRKDKVFFIVELKELIKKNQIIKIMH
jgi:hypothetical protein